MTDTIAQRIVGKSDVYRVKKKKNPPPPLTKQKAIIIYNMTYADT